MQIPYYLPETIKKKKNPINRQRLKYRNEKLSPDTKEQKN